MSISNFHRSTIVDITNNEHLKEEVKLEEIEGRDSKKPLSSSKAKCIAFYMIFCYLCMNLDNGAVPGSLKQIQEAFEYDDNQVGGLGSILYLGISLGTLAVLFLIEKKEGKREMQMVALYDPPCR